MRNTVAIEATHESIAMAISARTTSGATSFLGSLGDDGVVLGDTLLGGAGR
jgi:hypothetical protein